MASFVGIKESISMTLDDKTYSDIMVKFSGRQIHAHKVVLASRSRYFHRAFQSGFSVSSSRIIDMGEDDNPHDLQHMLQFIYSDSYAYRTLRLVDKGELNQHLRMYKLGDKYDIPSMRQYAASSWLNDALHSLPNSALGTIKEICGPSAIVFADPLLQENVMAYFREKGSDVLADPDVASALEDGTLLDKRFAGTALVQLGKRIREQNKETGHKDKKTKTGNKQGAA